MNETSEWNAEEKFPIFDDYNRWITNRCVWSENIQRESLYNSSDSTPLSFFFFFKNDKVQSCFFLGKSIDKRSWNKFCTSAGNAPRYSLWDNVITARVTIEFSRNLCSIARSERLCKSCSKEFITQIEEKLYGKNPPLKPRFQSYINVQLI